MMKRVAVLILGAMMLAGCGDDKKPSYSGTDWERKIDEYHASKFDKQEESLKEGLDLYVDYSTCIALAMKDRNSFFQREIVSELVGAKPNYYSIKGDSIALEKDDAHTLLNNVKEYYFANLKKAIDMMADGERESVLLTDGEYIVKKDNVSDWDISNPYMKDAMMKWLLRGHDIHILSESYKEPYKSGEYDKKRFYIFFTDRNLKNSVYDKIAKRIHPDNNINIEGAYHLSCSHAEVEKVNGKASVANEMLAPKVFPKNGYEVQEWQSDWRSIEENVVYNNVDFNTGEILTKGSEAFSGLKVNENCLLGFNIDDIEMKVYSITDEFSKFADSTLFADGAFVPEKEKEVSDFLTLDEDKKKEGELQVRFAPQGVYNPYFMESVMNYLRIDFYIKSATPNIGNYEKMFVFDNMEGGKSSENKTYNRSVYESIRQCVGDADIKAKVSDVYLYSVYVKSFAHE